MMSGVINPAFENMGSTPGIFIWRIEALQPVPVPKETYGKFFIGDCYLLLSVVDPGRGALKRDIFFWIGSECTQDESTAVALRAIELENSLTSGNHAPHHRECHEHESELFLSLFKGGVEYLAGGIDSGFTSVEERKKTRDRLLHVKGRRNIRCVEVPLEIGSLNSGDVFILDIGDTVIQFNGAQSSRLERARGLEMVTKIKSVDKNGRCTTGIVDEAENADDEIAQKFWNAFGGKQPIKTAEEGGDDLEFEKKEQDAIRLFWLCDESGELVTTEITEKPFKYSVLNHDDAYILDTGKELFAWVGKGATQQEKESSMLKAQNFLAEQGRPAWTPITRLLDGGETVLFKQYFSGWPASSQKHFAAKPQTLAARSRTTMNMPRGPRRDLTRVSIANMHSVAKQQAQKKDDLPTEMNIFKIVEREPEAVKKFDFGFLCSKACYLVECIWRDGSGNVRNSIIYFWLGANSKQDDRGAAALHTVHLSESYNASQVRVVEGHEPESFIGLFKGDLIVLKEDTKEAKEPRLFQVRGTSIENVYAIEVEAKCASLNSNDTFVLHAPQITYVWGGKGTSAEEKDVGVRVGKILAVTKRLKIINEEQEPEDFFPLLGGKTEYASDSSLYDEYREPRLFHCSDDKGFFYVEEIFSFAQDDLINDDVMILDTHNVVYVWVGEGSNVDEKRLAMETAKKYVEEAPDGRSPDTPIFRVNAGYEPREFTCHFRAWDAKKGVVKGDAYDAALAKLESVDATLNQLNQTTYPLEVLRARPLPEGVDPTDLPRYLSDEDFRAVFKMERDAFYALPRWKAVNLRKAAKLF